MRCASTRNSNETIEFQQAIFRPLASDGGLYSPVDPIDLSSVLNACRNDVAFVDLAVAVSTMLFDNDLPNVGDVTRRAFPFSPHIRPLRDNILLLELFHGPSCAFKDFGASFLAHSMEAILRRRTQRIVILTATSGDTGGAVAHAFAGREQLDVVILYPSGRVSPLQEKQLTTTGGNVTALEVNGTFDDCQRLVKTAFGDDTLHTQIPLASANSINLGRLLPQAFYYLYAAACLADEPPIFCVPSGNFGNLTSGVLASQWGMAVDGFIAATNINDVVPQYLNSGQFHPRPSIPTLSNAMDVGNPSNFERLKLIFNDDLDAMRAVIRGQRVTDTETLETMRRWYDSDGIILDPHTATGVLAAERVAQHPTYSQYSPRIVVLATAHPAKFGEIVQEALHIEPDIPDRLAEAMHKKKQAIRIEKDWPIFKDYLLTHHR